VLGIIQQNELCRIIQVGYSVRGMHLYLCCTLFTNLEFHLSPCLCLREKMVIIEDTYRVYPLLFRVFSFSVRFDRLLGTAVGTLL
jgi:hypothetical protein